MPIVGFNFDKIYADKKKKVEGKIDIKNKFGIKGVEEETITLQKNENMLRFNFEFNVDYEPKIGTLNFLGHVLYIDEKDKCKKIINQWKKDKKIEGTTNLNILNTIISKCTVRALNIAQEIGLPPHIPLPKVTPPKNQEEPKEYIG